MDPPRLRYSDSEDVRALLRQANPPRAMTAGERRRVERRLAHVSAAAAGFGVLFWLKGLALGAVVGTAAVVTHVVVEDAFTQDVQPSATSGVPVPAATLRGHPDTDAGSDVAEDAAEDVAEDGDAPPGTSVPMPSGSDGGDSLAAELALLQRAQSLLAGDPARALALTVEHAGRYPTGQLGMEREIVAIDALKRLGRRGEARQRGKALLVRARGSLYEERVRNLISE